MPLIPDVSAHDHHRGPLDASLVVVHYGDFECPYSGALAPLLGQIKEEVGDKLCLIFRPFPLSDLHPHALDAALAAEATGDKFWQMHDLLFGNQSDLEESDLRGYATQIGIEGDAFMSAMNADETREKVRNSLDSGRRGGAHGTPTLFINGEFYDNDRQLWKSSKLVPIIQQKLGE